MNIFSSQLKRDLVRKCNYVTAIIPSQSEDSISVIRQKPKYSKHATVFGGAGFLGIPVVKRLCNLGYQVIVPYRGDPFDSRMAKFTGDLSQVLFMPFHLNDEASLRRAIRNSTVVVNLLGKFSETYKVSFQELHVDAVGRIARMSREHDVKTFVHVSALNCASPVEPHILTNPKFISSKAEGEKVLKSEFPEAVIFRPSVMWGQKDSFLFSFLTHGRRTWRSGSRLCVPLWEKGTKTIKQPVFIEDVAEGIARVIQEASNHEGKIYQAVGPHRYRLDDLVRWIFMHIRLSYKKFEIIEPDLLFKTRLLIHQLGINDYPLFSMEQLEFESHSDVVDPNLPTLTDLNVSLAQMEDRLAWILKPCRRFGFNWDPLGELPEPPNPPLAIA